MKLPRPNGVQGAVMRLWFGIVTLVLTWGRVAAVAADAPDLQRVLRLDPGPRNPRNSEGDFLQLKDGRVLFVYTHFTGGEADSATAHLASRESRDGGLTWSTNDSIVVTNEGKLNIMSVSLLRLRSGGIVLFYLRKNSRGDCRPIWRLSTDEARTWSSSREMIPEEIGYYVLNNDRVIETSSGRIIVPLARHAGRDGLRHPGELLCYFSDDEGKTWRHTPPLTATGDNLELVDLMEPCVVEAAANDLLMVARTREGCQYEARSSDGAHWSAIVPGPLLSPLSPATIKRMPGTNTLICIWNDLRGEPKTVRTSVPPRRFPLRMARSQDRGHTWDKGITLEDKPQFGYCYVATEWVNDRLLLAYCSGPGPWGLAATQISAMEALKR